METLNSNVKKLNTLSGESKSVEAIQDWLVSYLAEQLKIAPQDIDTEMPFDRYGLDSAVAVSLTGDLEDLLGHRLSPTIAYDYPTIETLAQYLVEGEK